MPVRANIVPLQDKLFQVITLMPLCAGMIERPWALHHGLTGGR